MWTYRADLLKIVDGDTVDLVIDLGFQVSKIERVRLAGLDAPEMGTPGGLLAKEWVAQWFFSHQFDRPWDAYQYKVITQKGPMRDKYGRWVADVWYLDRHLNKEMLDAGHARVYPAP